MVRVGVLTISDKGSAGEREDASGALLRELIKKLPAEVVHYQILPDERDRIRAELIRLSDQLRLDLILTTGGTGVSPRDVTPEATEEAIERLIPGMGELMRMEGYRQNPRAIISRGIAGIRGRTLIINLPGSPRGVRENFEILLPALPHTLEKIRGDEADCAKP
jgi:molybdenum cofactor synthesis domain-containing protein